MSELEATSLVRVDADSPAFRHETRSQGVTLRFPQKVLTRRKLLQAVTVCAMAPPGRGAEPKTDLEGEIGVTTGSFMRHLSVAPTRGKLRLLDLPRIMRDELGMRVIDLMTRTLASFEPAYLDQLRERAEQAGCLLTNLKMNQPGLEMASPDPQRRAAALAEYQRTIDVAQRLGCRWVRPLPGLQRPDRARLIDAYRRLIDYAAERNVGVLIENFGWLSGDPDAIPEIVADVGPELLVSPDTGNWADEVRDEGLRKAFPRAVTCDFKAFQLAADGSHRRYDLRRCFQIGWDAGFRGPWCLEHFNESLDGLMSGMTDLQGRLQQWIKDQSTPESSC